MPSRLRKALTPALSRGEREEKEESSPTGGEGGEDPDRLRVDSPLSPRERAGVRGFSKI
jgi:hypothetical protein